MTIVIVVILTLIIGTPIISYIAYRKGKSQGESKALEEFKNMIESGKGKYGIIVYSSAYYGIAHVIEIEELESAGDLTKVKVIKVCSNANIKDSAESVLKDKSFNQWVKTNSITWFNDNSQRLRDEKIKEILGEKS